MLNPNQQSENKIWQDGSTKQVIFSGKEENCFRTKSQFITFGEKLHKLHEVITTPSMYFKEHFKGLNDYFTILTLQPQIKVKCFSKYDFDKLDQFVKDLNQISDIYFGVGILKEKPLTGRGKNESVIGITALSLDIDVVSPAHKEKNLPENKTVALELVHSLPIKPSSVIDTGNGLQVHYFLNEPWLFGDSGRSDAIKLTSNFHKVIQKLFEKYKIDNVSDIARILRVPLTTNMKNPEKPLEVKILEFNNIRYSLEEIQEFIDRNKPQDNVVTLVTTKSNVDNAQQGNEEDYPETDAELIRTRCNFINHCVIDAEDLPEPHWNVMTNIIVRTENGVDKVHEYSSPYEKYTPEETDKKIQHILDKGYKPHACTKIQDLCGEEYCENCKFKGKITSPINLGVMPNEQYSIVTLPEFPVEVLPAPCQNFIREVSKSINCPTDYLGTGLLAFAATVIGNSRQIHLNFNMDETPIIYAALIGKPGQNKSAPLRMCKNLTDYIDQENNLQYHQAREKYDSDRIKYEVELKKWKQNAKKDDSTDTESQPEPPKSPKQPVRRRLTITDSTVEALAEILRDNPRGLIYYSDEIDSFFKRLNEYKGNSGDRSMWLNKWNGGVHTVDRKGKDPIYIKNFFVSVVGGVQPQRLQQIYRKDTCDDGFLDRFLFCYSERPINPELSSEDVNPVVVQYMKDIFCNLSQLSFKGVPEMVNLSTGARKVYKDWYREATLTGEEIGTPRLSGFYSKSKNYAGRFALILHCISTVLMDTENEYEVSEKTMKNAVTLMRYYIDHYKKVCEIFSSDDKSEKVDYVLKWLKKKNIDVITPREILNSNKGRFKDVQEVKNILSVLVKSGKGLWTKVGKSDKFIRFDN